MIIFLLVACSAHSPRIVTDVEKKIVKNTVSILPQKKPPLTVSTDNIMENSNSYGPSLGRQPHDNLLLAQEKSIATGLFLGAGGVRTFAELELLKEFKKRGIIISSISGVGLGAVVAAYYAMGTKLSQIEWKLYLFFEKSQGVQLYSNRWIALVDEILLKDFSKRMFSHLRYNLAIPLYIYERREVVFISKGYLRDRLLSNLKLSSYKALESTALGKKFTLAPFKKMFGVDYLIGMNPLAKEMQLDISTGFLRGNLEKESGLMDTRLEIVDLRVSLPRQRMSLDSTKKIANYLLKAKNISEMVTLQLKYNLKHFHRNLDL